MLKRILLAALVAIASLVIWSSPRVEALQISAPFVTVGVGDTFTIPISIASATDLTSWQFDLAFNPAIVKANSVTEGPFMSAFGTTFFGPGVINNAAGLLSLVTDDYVDLPPLPTGNGVLANIEFTALFPGVSPLSFSNVLLNLSNQGFEIANGQITPRIPEPATLALLISGLVLLALLRRVKVRVALPLGSDASRHSFILREVNGQISKQQTGYFSVTRP